MAKKKGSKKKGGQNQKQNQQIQQHNNQSNLDENIPAHLNSDINTTKDQDALLQNGKLSLQETHLSNGALIDDINNNNDTTFPTLIDVNIEIQQSTILKNGNLDLTGKVDPFDFIGDNLENENKIGEIIEEIKIDQEVELIQSKLVVEIPPPKENILELSPILKKKDSDVKAPPLLNHESNQTIYLVHISDIHIFPPEKTISPDTEDPHTIKRYQGLINVKYGRGVGDFRKLEEVKVAIEKSFNIDKCHFIVTGDLTNVSLRAEFDYCHRELKRLFLRNDNITVIPGNHDMYVETARERFIQYYHSMCWKGNEERTFPFVKTLPTGSDTSIILVGFNSGVPTKLFIAAGNIGEDQINKGRSLVSNILNKEKNKKHLICVLLHHPPAKRYNKFIEWMGMLDDASKLRIQKFCKEFNAHLVLNGHTHEPHISILPDSDSLVIDCGSTTMNSPKEKTSFFNVYQVTGTRISRSWQYIWNDEEQCFKDTKLVLPLCRVTHNPLENSNSSFYSNEMDSDQEEDGETNHSPFSMMQSTSIKMEAHTY